tara:strand:+ start:352 stop:552 length:201 start_codon:yes stop_codon:yes gene_type:complete
MKMADFIKGHEKLGIGAFQYIHAFMAGHYDKNKPDEECPYSFEPVRKAYFMGKRNKNQKIIKKYLT